MRRICLAAAGWTTPRDEDLVLATLISVPPGSTFRAQFLHNFLRSRLANDDVWQPSFLRDLFVGSTEAVTLEPDLLSAMRSLGVDKIHSQVCDAEFLPLSGPY